ncbi:Zinc metalloproteinase nas-8 [Trichinella pseudospiralis]|uniref:Metalloendopeptidase n=1 Tax=Trichinella pseudospiralis TaxID=6337 RepID=A0A0V1FJJ9_TRIPS|nr:Zinc metalloproteinase nas-8 [Trichinella pseudospiralis]
MQCSKVLPLVTQHAMVNRENELFILLPMASCSGCKNEWRNAVQTVGRHASPSVGSFDFTIGTGLSRSYAFPSSAISCIHRPHPNTNGSFEPQNDCPAKELYGSETHPPWQQGIDKFQGDIVGKAVMRRRLKTRGVSRNGVRMTKDKWPNNEVPYVLSDYYTTKERAIIARAMKAYHDRTCVRFVPRTFEPDYLYIGKIDGCFSDVGRGGGRQELSLDFGCIDYETVIHELMHAVGFWHEHERWDRDNYIQILWNNVDRGGYDQFGKANLLESDYYDENYDYFSILHYDSKAFSRNGRNTIEARMPGMTAIIGRMKDFSPVDLRKINKMYNCSSYYTYAAGNPGKYAKIKLPSAG